MSAESDGLERVDERLRTLLAANVDEDAVWARVSERIALAPVVSLSTRRRRRGATLLAVAATMLLAGSAFAASGGRFHTLFDGGGRSPATAPITSDGSAGTRPVEDRGTPSDQTPTVSPTDQVGRSHDGIAGGSGDGSDGGGSRDGQDGGSATSGDQHDQGSDTSGSDTSGSDTSGSDTSGSDTSGGSGGTSGDQSDPTSTVAPDVATATANPSDGQ